MNDASHAPSELGPAILQLLDASHLLEPDDLPATVRQVGRGAGALDVRLHLVDYEQRELHLFSADGEAPGEPASVDGTVAGKVFSTLEVVEVVQDGVRRLLVPLLDGTDRFGVLEVCLSDDDDREADIWEPFAALVAELVLSKSAYGDRIPVARRSRPMALRAEAQRQLLPPLTLITPRVAVTGMLVPSYEVAGDLFDYALNGDTLHLAVFDAMGHSLGATLTAAVAISAYRNSRRAGQSLVEHWRAADNAVRNEFDDHRFVTAVFAELDLTDGRFCSLSAGHPSALVARENRVIARCADEPALPVGLGEDEPAVTETGLQPGDRLLLFTDGIVEARSASGAFFGEERLVDDLAQQLDSGLPVPEAVRRIVMSVFEHQSGRLRDDATLVLAEWRGRDK